MKFKNIIKLLVLVAFAFVAVSFSTNRASASTRVHYVDSFPKQMRGIWYQVVKYKGQKGAEALEITKKKVYQEDSDGSKYGIVLHNVNEKHVKDHKKAFFKPKYAGYYIGDDGKKVYFVKPWNAKKGSKPNSLLSYTKFKGHQMLVLYDAEYNRDFGFFRTPKLAKEFVNNVN